MAADLAVVPDPPQPPGQRDIVDGWIPHAAAIIRLAEYICDTDFVPETYRGNGPAVAGAMLAGRELNIGPLMGLWHVQLVRGHPSLSAEYKRGRVLAAGHEFDIIERTMTRCRVAGRRAGSTRPPLEVTYTIEDARRAKLTRPGSAWETRPRRMLFARASSELCDALFSDVVLGLPTAELLETGTDEDAFAGYDEAPGQAAPETQTAAPGRARRKTAAAGPAARDQAPPAGDTAREASPVPAGDAPPGGGLPPLPGEEEEAPAGAAHRPVSRHAAPAGPDPADRDAKRHQHLIGVIKGHLERLGYPRPFGKDETDDERTARLADLAAIAGVSEIGTVNDLDTDELSGIADLLSRPRTRDDLDDLLAAMRRAREAGDGDE